MIFCDTKWMLDAWQCACVCVCLRERVREISGRKASAHLLMLMTWEFIIEVNIPHLSGARFRAPMTPVRGASLRCGDLGTACLLPEDWSQEHYNPVLNPSSNLEIAPPPPPPASPIPLNPNQAGLGSLQRTPALSDSSHHIKNLRSSSLEEAAAIE